MEGSIHHFTVLDNPLDLLQVTDLLQRILIHDYHIGQLASLNGPEPIQDPETLGGISRGRQNDLHRRQPDFVCQDFHLMMEAKAGYRPACRVGSRHHLAARLNVLADKAQHVLIGLVSELVFGRFQIIKIMVPIEHPEPVPFRNIGQFMAAEKPVILQFELVALLMEPPADGDEIRLQIDVSFHHQFD